MNPRFVSVLAAVLMVTGCGSKDDKAAKKPSPPTAANDNPIAAPVNYLGAVAAAKKMAEKQLDLVSVNQAIQQFRAMEDRNPASLDEMVKTHYLREVPKAPYGMTLIYDPASGTARIVQAPPQAQPAGR